MKIYFLCPKATWVEHGHSLGETHGNDIGTDGTFLFCAFSRNLDPGVKRQFDSLPNVIELPSLLDSAGVGWDAAKLFPPVFNVASGDTMYMVARKLMQLNPVFDPNAD